MFEFVLFAQAPRVRGLASPRNLVPRTCCRQRFLFAAICHLDEQGFNGSGEALVREHIHVQSIDAVDIGESPVVDSAEDH